MRIGRALSPERRAAVVELLRDTDLTFVEIEARTGVNRKTVACWNARAGHPRGPTRGRGPAAWRHARREALIRLYRERRNDPRDLAEAVGVGRAGTEALFRTLGVAPRAERPEPGRSPGDDFAPLDAASAADAPTLRAHLRAHIARQIAAFDAALKGEGAAVLDSARVLRDLGGLKRLFDEVVRDDSDAAGERGAGEFWDGGTGPDLPALRAEIARRYARFVDARDAS